MEFINLDEALNGIAACFSVHEFSEYQREKKISGSAGLLHQLLNNTQEGRPRWVEINSVTKKAVFSDAAIFSEGMEILLHTAGWFDREWKNHVRHMIYLSTAKEKGIDLDLVIKSHNINDGQYSMPQLQHQRPYVIGFDATELIALLDLNQIEHSLKQRSAMPDFATHSTSNTETIDYSLLATRDQLINCFGKFTGMDISWFTNLKDTPKLKAARKIKGQGGRGHTQQPLFCPLEVMQWLIADNRRKGSRSLSADKAWSLLESGFPRVYFRNSSGDTRTG